LSTCRGLGGEREVLGTQRRLGKRRQRRKDLMTENEATKPEKGKHQAIKKNISSSAGIVGHRGRRNFMTKTWAAWGETGIPKVEKKRTKAKVTRKTKGGQSLKKRNELVTGLWSSSTYWTQHSSRRGGKGGGEE